MGRHLVIVRIETLWANWARSLADALAVGGNEAVRASLLSKEVGESDDVCAWQSGLARIDQVLKDRPGADGRKLIHVAHKNELRVAAHAGQDLIPQPVIDHGGFVDDQHLLFDGARTSAWHADAQVPMDGGGLSLGGGRELLAGAAGGGAEGIGATNRLQAAYQ